jgi:hypothetical protein
MTPADLEGIPNGALVEMKVRGRLQRAADRCVSLRPDGEALTFGLVGTENYQYPLLTAVTAVEVLPEPVVEPTKRLAMVTDRHGCPWVQVNEWPPTRWQTPGEVGPSILWEVLVDNSGPLTVIFEGTP